MLGITAAKVSGAIAFWVLIGFVLIITADLEGEKLFTALALMGGASLISILFLRMETNMNGHELTKESYIELKNDLKITQCELNAICKEIITCADNNDAEGIEFWNLERIKLIDEVKVKTASIEVFRKELSDVRNAALRRGDMAKVNELMF